MLTTLNIYKKNNHLSYYKCCYYIVIQKILFVEILNISLLLKISIFRHIKEILKLIISHLQTFKMYNFFIVLNVFSTQYSVHNI